MISVVIPVKNRASLVRRTLDSVAAQTVQPEKIILVDNNSTDSSVEVLRSWASSHPNAEVISELKPGAAAARNAGLARATTPYIMFFDSDDVMPPRHIEEVSAALNRSAFPDILEFPSEFIDSRGHRKLAPLRSGDPMKNHIFHATLATQRYCASTELLRSAGAWNEDLLGWDDLELGVRLLATSPRYAQTDLSQPVSVYTHADSITGSDFSSKAGQWERALDCCEVALSANDLYRRYIGYRRAILAGNYRRERHSELGHGLTRGWWLKLIASYVACGGRGVATLANIEKIR